MVEAQPPPSAEYPPRLPAPAVLESRPGSRTRTRRDPLGPLGTSPNVEATAAVAARGDLDLSSDYTICASSTSSATCDQVGVRGRRMMYVGHLAVSCASDTRLDGISLLGPLRLPLWLYRVCARSLPARIEFSPRWTTRRGTDVVCCGRQTYPGPQKELVSVGSVFHVTSVAFRRHRSAEVPSSHHHLANSTSEELNIPQHHGLGKCFWWRDPTPETTRYAARLPRETRNSRLRTDWTRWSSFIVFLPSSLLVWGREGTHPYHTQQTSLPRIAFGAFSCPFAEDPRDKQPHKGCKMPDRSWWNVF